MSHVFVEVFCIAVLALGSQRFRGLGTRVQARVLCIQSSAIRTRKWWCKLTRRSPLLSSPSPRSHCHCELTPSTASHRSKVTQSSLLRHWITSLSAMMMKAKRLARDDSDSLPLPHSMFDVGRSMFDVALLGHPQPQRPALPLPRPKPARLR